MYVGILYMLDMSWEQGFTKVCRRVGRVLTKDWLTVRYECPLLVTFGLVYDGRLG